MATRRGAGESQGLILPPLCQHGKVEMISMNGGILNRGCRNNGAISENIYAHLLLFSC